jgi:hypothetical protein
VNESKFIYAVGDRTYVLVPEVRVSARRTWLLGAGMYSLDDEYIGYWHRGQMPLPVIRQLTEHARKARIAAGLPQYDRVRSYTRRRGKR